jgi:uridine kinase
LCNLIVQRFHQHRSANAFTIAISGIDASGKSSVAAQIKYLLEENNLNVALLNIDDWQMPKSISFLKENAAANFYHNAFRWNAFFDSLLIPLQNNHSVNVTANLVDINKDKVYSKQYSFTKVDIILVEGIFLLMKDTRAFFDYKVWIECSFKTAQQRAIARNQEGLLPEQLIYDYKTFYYPAQLFHFKKDRPQHAADFIFNNDI